MSASNVVADVFPSAEPRRFPSAEDMRMVRAIAMLSFLEAVRHGTYHATFHGFRVAAVRRDGLGRDAPTVEIHLVVTFDGRVVERCALDVDEMRSAWPKSECERGLVVDGATFARLYGH
jgi:hypothetical protein